MQAVKGGTLGAEMTLQRTQVVSPSKASHSKAIQSDQKRSLLICRRPSYLRRVVQVRSVCLVRNRLACRFSGNRTENEGKGPQARKFICSAVRAASDLQHKEAHPPRTSRKGLASAQELEYKQTRRPGSQAVFVVPSSAFYCA
jgi:hypothetical protein